jgi:uncharacterized membrane protein YeiH
LHFAGCSRELAVTSGVVLGFALRGGALIRGWTLPRYRPRPPRQ